MRKIIYPLIFMLLIGIVYAHGDLEEFPENFIDGNELDAYIVVGDKASSSDVIAQSNLVLFFGKETNAPVQGKAKLASEITNLKQNLILIGNPCVNRITAQVMGNPLECDEDFEPGKAIIRLMHNNGYDYLIIAGYSDKGTREAANVLANYKNYDLDDDEFVIDIPGEAAAPKPVVEVKNETKNTTAKPVEEPQVKDTETAIKPVEPEKPQAAAEPKEEPTAPEKQNVVSRFFKWIFSWF